MSYAYCTVCSPCRVKFPSVTMYLTPFPPISLPSPKKPHLTDDLSNAAELFQCVAWMDTVNSLVWWFSATDTIPICKRKNVLFFSALKLLLFTGENLENIGK